jgi:hypothetical protein
MLCWTFATMPGMAFVIGGRRLPETHRLPASIASLADFGSNHSGAAEADCKFGELHAISPQTAT